MVWRLLEVLYFDLGIGRMFGEGLHMISNFGSPGYVKSGGVGGRI